MSDLVVTCPKQRWRDWLREGDAAGEPPTGQLYQWQLSSWSRPPIERGDRLYMVAHARLRGWAPVVRVEWCADDHVWLIIRGGGAVACTIDGQVTGFPGWRPRWWPREAEQPFPDWRHP